MWYNTETEEWVSERELRNILYDFANENKEELFSVDDIIDEYYPPFEMFGVTFYASTIIKTDMALYGQINEEFLSGWVDETIYRINSINWQEGDALSTLEEPIFYFSKIIWKEEYN